MPTLSFAEEVSPPTIYTELGSLPQSDAVSTVEEVESFMLNLISEPASVTQVEEREPMVEHDFKINIRLIDKRLGRVRSVELLPEKAQRFGDIVFLGRGCAEDRGSAFVNVLELTTGESLFSGWLYSQTPSVTGLSHPVYEVKLEHCTVE